MTNTSTTIIASVRITKSSTPNPQGFRFHALLIEDLNSGDVLVHETRLSRFEARVRLERFLADLGLSHRGPTV